MSRSEVTSKGQSAIPAYPWCAVTEGRLPSQEGRGEGGW
jgi:hypothetical protein